MAVAKGRLGKLAAIAGLDGGAAKNYGLASALSIVIFLIVATISVISFKKTRTLEEIN